MNDILFQKLTEISSNPNYQISKKDYEEMGLSSKADKAFLSQLIKLYNFNINLQSSYALCC